MDPIKEAFYKIKEDISSIKEDIAYLNLQIKNIQSTPTYNVSPTLQHSNTPTHKSEEESLYYQNFDSSIGNDGVPTDKQTNQPIDQHSHKNTFNLDFNRLNNIISSLDEIKKEIRIKFKRLTPQEMLVFSVFTS